MTTKVDRLRAEAEKARQLAEEAEAEAAREAEAEKERVAAIEREFYAGLEDEYFAAPALITDARTKFVMVALTGDLQATYSAWQEWQRVWSEQAAWTNLIHFKVWGRSGQRPRRELGDDSPMTTLEPIIAARVGISDFSEDLKNALRGVLKDEAGAAYVKERTADLRAKVGK